MMGNCNDRIIIYAIKERLGIDLSSSFRKNYDYNLRFVRILAERKVGALIKIRYFNKVLGLTFIVRNLKKKNFFSLL